MVVAMTSDLVLQGRHVRLEPLERRHVAGLAAASAGDPALYQWSPVPQGEAAAADYVDTALAWKAAGRAVPFAIVRTSDGAVLGSTRFFELSAGRGRKAIRSTAAVRPMPVRSATPGWRIPPSA